MKLQRSASDPDTRVAAVAAKTNWKNHLESLYAETKKRKVKEMHRGKRYVVRVGKNP